MKLLIEYNCYMDGDPLEMWVNAEVRPVKLRLTGQLDAWTAGNLLPIIKELLADGFREFELRTSELNVPDAVGARTLGELRQLVEASGGRVIWDGTTAERPQAVERTAQLRCHSHPDAERPAPSSSDERGGVGATGDLRIPAEWLRTSNASAKPSATAPNSW